MKSFDQDQKTLKCHDIIKELQSGLHVQESSANMMSFMVQDLLDYSQIKADKFRKVLKTFNIRQSIEKVMCIQRQKAIDLKLDFYAEFVNIKMDEQEQDEEVNGIQKYCPVIHCDEQRIMQVLLGLQSNALKFTQNGKVMIRVEIILKDSKEKPNEKERYLQISVVDTGIGIAKEDHHKLFKLFGFVKDS